MHVSDTSKNEDAEIIEDDDDCIDNKFIVVCNL